MSSLMVLALLIAAVVIHETYHAVAGSFLKMPAKAIYLGLPIFPKLSFVLGDKKVVISPWLVGGGVLFDQAGLSFWQKCLTTLAGPFANIAFAAGTARIAVFLDPNIERRVLEAFAKASDVLAINTPKDIPGLVWIFQFASRLTSVDTMVSALFFWVSLNLGLGILNMIPFPGLDGGQAVSQIIVALMGNREKYVRRINLINIISMASIVGLSTLWIVWELVKFVLVR